MESNHQYKPRRDLSKYVPDTEFYLEPQGQAPAFPLAPQSVLPTELLTFIVHS